MSQRERVFAIALGGLLIAEGWLFYQYWWAMQQLGDAQINALRCAARFLL